MPQNIFERTRDRREREAGLEDAPAPPPAPAPTPVAAADPKVKFTKGFTPEERAKQAKALTAMLRNR